MSEPNTYQVNLDPNAHALRVVRIIESKNEMRLYEAITFPKNPWQGCELYLRRCKALGKLSEEKTGFVIDVLDKEGDIIQDFGLTKAGFEYLRRVLKFKVEREDN